MAHSIPTRLPSKEAPFVWVTHYGYRLSLASLEEVFDRLERDRVVLIIREGALALDVAPFGWHRYAQADLELLDGQGQPVDLKWLAPLYRHHLATAHERRAALPGFRQGSVKGISKWRGGRSMFRHPHTTRTLRQVDARVSEELEPDWRGRTKALPTAWDDIYARPSRSWKNHRQHQWKVLR